jgi:Ca2+-binding EF-hand superfamily protein
VNQSQFDEIDKDGDGMISKEELEAFLKKKCGCSGGKSLSPAEQMKRLVSDWLLIGLSIIVLLSFAGAQK